jgi:hypothetical protein
MTTSSWPRALKCLPSFVIRNGRYPATERDAPTGRHLADERLSGSSYPEIGSEVRSGAKPSLKERPLKKTILTFGLISGGLISLMMALTVPFQDKLGHSYVIGYTTIVLSLMLTYFGVRSYRDNVAQGQITFGKAFLVGLSITVISCLCYVVTWEIIYFNFMPDFMDKYGAQVLQKMQAAGATAAAIQQKAEELNKFKNMYKNPLFNAALTFIEPFPVGLVITLFSAAVLRKKAPAPSEPAVAVP